jgi:hypothetical protein
MSLEISVKINIFKLKLEKQLVWTWRCSTTYSTLMNTYLVEFYYPHFIADETGMKYQAGGHIASKWHMLFIFSITKWQYEGTPFQMSTNSWLYLWCGGAPFIKALVKQRHIALGTLGS